MKPGLTLARFLIIVAVVAFVLGILRPVGMRVLIDPKPKLPPDEQNRITHPNGFSIIAPEGWISVVNTDAEDTRSSIVIFPKHKARFKPSLAVIEYGNSEEAHHITKSREYRKSKYLDFEAEIFEGRSARYHDWHAIFVEDEIWYGVELVLPHGKHGTRYEKAPDYWWPFLNSFRIEPTPAE